jgi:c(7)-type cytochrome triheme protein
MRGAVLFLIIVLLGGGSYMTFWDFPKLPPPSQYGNVLMNRTSEKNGQRPVVFSHWFHRTKYTCRVCHFELGFIMEANQTEVTEKQNREGEWCGTCHNGTIAFGHTEENCKKCHSGNMDYGRKKFDQLKERMPKSPYGNKINWAKALRKKMIWPKQSILEEDYQPIPFEKKLILKPEWAMAKNAIAVFSHKTHIQWLDCADCHPDIFNIQKKGTRHFRMEYILERKFCGACHTKVAFPIQYCRPCHPKIKTKKY